MLHDLSSLDWHCTSRARCAHSISLPAALASDSKLEHWGRGQSTSGCAGQQARARRCEANVSRRIHLSQYMACSLRINVLYFLD